MLNIVVTVQGLNKAYRKTNVLKNLDLQLCEGQVLGLLGSNGAGKTTLLETLVNLRDDYSGKIELWGQPWKELDDAHRQTIGFVPESPSGFEWMKVRYYLDYFGAFYPHWDPCYCEHLTGRWKLDPKRRLSELSGGQRAILAVIQALSIRPKLLILDEPVAHLDPGLRRDFMKQIIELSCDHQCSVLFSTHIISDLERIASHLALLRDGRIVGGVQELDAIKETHGGSLEDWYLEAQHARIA